MIATTADTVPSSNNDAVVIVCKTRDGDGNPVISHIVVRIPKGKRIPLLHDLLVLKNELPGNILEIHDATSVTCSTILDKLNKFKEGERQNQELARQSFVN
jgi:hypothetical protein